MENGIFTYMNGWFFMAHVGKYKPYMDGMSKKICASCYCFKLLTGPYRIMMKSLLMNLLVLLPKKKGNPLKLKG